MQISSPPPTPPKKWTVLVWSASDNDLYTYNLKDVDEAELTGPNPDLNFVAQIDHGAKAQRLELVQDASPGLQSRVVAELGDVNMGSSAALADFLEWGIKNYPAENYWLVISDHGDGWKGACQDESQQGWMSLPMLGEGLRQARSATGRRLAVLSFDCCLMASAEVAHELKDEARYLVGSQEVMGYKGLPYDQVLDPAGRLGLTPRQLVERLVKLSTQDQEDTPTLSALDTARVPELTDAVRELGQGILGSALTPEALRQIVGETQDFTGYKDVHDLAERLAEADPTLSEAAGRVKRAVRAAVVAEQHGPTHPRAHGVQLETSPDTESSRMRRRVLANGLALTRSQAERYVDTAFAQSTGWDRVIAHIHAPTTPACPS